MYIYILINRHLFHSLSIYTFFLISLCLQIKDRPIEKIVNRYTAYTCSNIVIDFFGIETCDKREPRTQVASNVIALNDIPGFQCQKRADVFYNRYLPYVMIIR